MRNLRGYYSGFSTLRNCRSQSRHVGLHRFWCHLRTRRFGFRKPVWKLAMNGHSQISVLNKTCLCRCDFLLSIDVLETSPEYSWSSLDLRDFAACRSARGPFVNLEIEPTTEVLACLARTDATEAPGGACLQDIECRLRMSVRLNVSLHALNLQAYGLSPVCMRACLWRFSSEVNIFPQVSQTYEPQVICSAHELICAVRPDVCFMPLSFGADLLSAEKLMTRE